ncbi:CehA/McbA family metallohydrolase [Nonomuraea glycinis]|uniref:Phosphoesterase n=1 Tax=Nonomuraea glycinis TaxID=2047744 RepID=A0A918A3N9_9ACTN|nr:CehA/McbA family metallohydrolase [Nonomuraea glycinis]MCA2183300.1 CehA/McbA family metallohydrolase [Nonomuraea glycinis]GGP04471.1 phosphoesterase [Nonomuraea glycinis]
MSVIRGHWSLDDRLERILREVAFEVPAGTAAVTVRLAYDRSQGVLDLGCAGADGFRGWSGGARDTYTITEDWATPGYLPGEPEPGVWNVWLRLHRVPPQGLDFTLEIHTETVPPARPEVAEPPAGERPPRRDIPDLGGMRWFAGDFHAHTLHSDGSLTIAELAELARGRGLDFLAVTDHNTVSHHPELAKTDRGITLLPGQEVTTDRGHANVFGDVGWVDFRQPADSWVRHAGRAGGLISINHPLGGDCAWLQPLTERPRIAEVWHSGWWDRRWGAPLAWADAWRSDLVWIGASDFHKHGSDGLPGSPTTWVLAEDTGSVLDAVSAGRTAISAGPDAPLLLRLGDELLALDADGLILVRPDGARQVIRGDRVLLPADPGRHRLETYENEVMALCA